MGAVTKDAGPTWLAPRRLGSTLALALLGCGEPQSLPCEEVDGATELPRVVLGVGETALEAELAASEDERRTAWAERRCGLDGLLWVPDEIGPAAVTLCGVEVAVDLAFLRDGEVVAVERERAPCDAACDDCPAYGEDGPEVDAVLWLVSGTLEVVPGDRVTGLDGVDLPAPPEAGSTG